MSPEHIEPVLILPSIVQVHYKHVIFRNIKIIFYILCVQLHDLLVQLLHRFYRIVHERPVRDLGLAFQLRNIGEWRQAVLIVLSKVFGAQLKFG